MTIGHVTVAINTLRPEKNDWHFADKIFNSVQFSTLSQVVPRYPTDKNWSTINIGSDNGLAPDRGAMPLPKPMKTLHSRFCEVSLWLVMYTYINGLMHKDITPLLTHWSYIFLALTHRYFPNTNLLKAFIWAKCIDQFVSMWVRGHKAEAVWGPLTIKHCTVALTLDLQATWTSLHHYNCYTASSAEFVMVQPTVQRLYNAVNFLQNSH